MREARRIVHQHVYLSNDFFIFYFFVSLCVLRCISRVGVVMVGCMYLLNYVLGFDYEG